MSRLPCHDWKELGDYFAGAKGAFGKYTVWLSAGDYKVKFHETQPAFQFLPDGSAFIFPVVGKIIETEKRYSGPVENLRFGSLDENGVQFIIDYVSLWRKELCVGSGDVLKIERLRRKFHLSFKPFSLFKKQKELVYENPNLQQK